MIKERDRKVIFFEVAGQFESSIGIPCIGMFDHIGRGFVRGQLNRIDFLIGETSFSGTLADIFTDLIQKIEIGGEGYSRHLQVKGASPWAPRGLPILRKDLERTNPQGAHPLKRIIAHFYKLEKSREFQKL